LLCIGNAKIQKLRLNSFKRLAIVIDFSSVFSLGASRGYIKA